MKRVPFNAMNVAIHKRLVEEMSIPVLDDVAEDIKESFISLGSFTCKDTGTKVDDIVDAILDINVWSAQQSKQEVNLLADKVITALCCKKFDLQEDGFNFMGLTINSFEMNPENNRGRGIITVVAKIQNKE